MTNLLKPLGMIFTLISPVVYSALAIAAPPDAGLYAMYFLSSDYTGLNVEVCGTVPGSEGCYGGGTLGPFKHAGAVVSGTEAVVGNVVNRAVYVVDVAAGASGTDVVLYRFRITETINPPGASIQVTMTNTIPLPLVGGAGARCSLAATSGFLFIGTDQSSSAVRVAKQGFAVETIGGFSNDPTVASITVDDRGYVIVAFATTTADGDGTVEFGPDGNSVGDGGGAYFSLPSGQGLSTKDIPTFLGPLPTDTRFTNPPRLTTGTP